ncbi:hypothetical protein AUP68_14686 [Ilyonectria robusta]
MQAPISISFQPTAWGSSSRHASIGKVSAAPVFASRVLAGDWPPGFAMLARSSQRVTLLHHLAAGDVSSRLAAVDHRQFTFGIGSDQCRPHPTGDCTVISRLVNRN